VEVVCGDRRQLLDLTNRMRALEGVVSTESFFYLDMWKQLYDWGTHIDDGRRPSEAASS
jgi:Lrp/AsnC family transcriptional regulator for asnA, asnC and gidA